MFVYSIQCEFMEDGWADEISRWVDWMREVHIPDVIRSGALSAEFIRFEQHPPVFQVLYHFESAETFAVYEQDQAPRLRGESLREFPPETGLSYRRNYGERVGQFDK